MERVLIIGCSGAGKSVLASRLSDVLGLPIIHLDQHYWRPGWIAPDRATWTAQVEALITQPKWVMDGNYGSSLPLRLAAADTVIFLDFPTWLCLCRVIKRTASSFRRTRPDVAPGCPERVDWPFLKFVWSYRRIHRPRVYAALEGFRGRLSVLKGPSEARQFLSQVGTSNRA
jgi:adenylate kinase family enzyme